MVLLRLFCLLISSFLWRFGPSGCLGLSGLRVWFSGFSVPGWGFRVFGCGFRVERFGLEPGAQGFEGEGSGLVCVERGLLD